LAAIVIAVSLLGAGLFISAEMSGQNSQDLEIAMMPQEDPTQIMDEAQPFAEYLEEKLGKNVNVEVPMNYAATTESILRNHSQIAFLSGWPAQIAIEDGRKENIDIVPIAAEERPEIVEMDPSNPVKGEKIPNYYSHIYAREDGAIESLEDLEGKEIAFTSQTSTSGYLMPVAMLVQHDLIRDADEVEEFFSEAIFAGGYEQALSALARGDVDAAASSDYAFYRFLDEDERGKTRTVHRRKTTTHMMVARGDLSDSTLEIIREAVTDEKGQELLEKIYGAESYTLIGDNHLEPIRTALKMTEIQR